MRGALPPRTPAWIGEPPPHDLWPNVRRAAENVYLSVEIALGTERSAMKPLRYRAALHEQGFPKPPAP